ncbi:PhnE/PtxC family ABC transporter permease [Thalassolituus sp. LLYu03]|uniref:PhnE/PtxC family ABC transporter permease n=1 Tax=Thalassolituus sp. LLYu03 TaxID=3421656 RepID=UPI003D270AB4
MRSDISTGKKLGWLSFAFLISALLCLPFADLALYQSDPWRELGRIALGFVTPWWDDPQTLLDALGQTIAFALLAVLLSVPLGVVLAVLYHWRVVRLIAAAVRSVHEIFWGLLFMQVFGLSATTGLLAILIPYTGVFTKVFAELFARQSPYPEQAVAARNRRFSRYAYTRIPQAYGEIAHYVRYRFECALRSSAILGFIGLPTLGFHLETAFKQGHYSEAAALLWLFFILIATIRFWLKPKLIPVYAVVAVFLLPQSPPMASGLIWQFLTHDIWPKALLNGDWTATAQWYSRVWSNEAWPSLLQTLLLTQLALVLTGVIALLVYPFGSRALVGRARPLGRGVLLVMRSTPEMMFAFVLLLLFGPSGLPAVLALAIHNGGLIGFLMAGHSEQQPERPDDPAGLNRYAYLHTPRLYPGFLAFLFYRWEVILRESAIMGILGVATLGFYIDSAFEEVRFDKAFFLILVTAALNILVDSVSRRLRRLAGAEQAGGLG